MLTSAVLDVSIAGISVCRGLDLSLAAGGSLAILGRNGAGKSTLLATLAGLRPAQGGHIAIAGIPLPARDGRALAARRGYLAQQQHDAFATEVLEAVLAGRHPHLSRWEWESSADRRIAEQALFEVGLAGFGGRPLSTLSGGERQRVALATLLAQQPALYLTDEPLTHLDLNHQIAALEILARLARDGAAVAAVLHDPSLALRYFGQALLLFGDGAWLAGPAAEVLTAENLSRLYGHPLRRYDGGGHPVFIPE
jgi:iron complex transport system ATP-binding protein